MKIQRAAAAAAALAAAGGTIVNSAGNNTADRSQQQQDNNGSPAPTATATTAAYLQDTRTHVVGELYDTERSYVESLQILVEKYMKPLKNLDSNRAPLIESSLVDEIFYTIPEILHHHENFLSALQERLSSDWDSSQVIGNVFIEAFTNQQVIDTYAAFINNWKNARHAIKVAIQAKPAFERFLEAMSREHRNKLTLDALLIMPVQRIPRYELLIKELIKHTPEDHPDHGPLIEAQKRIHELALKIDQAEKEMIHQEQLRDLESLIEGHVELQHPQRDFIRYDLVTISASTLTVAKKERVLFLFCDLLIITSVKKKVSRRSNLQSAFANSTNDISLLEGNKFKLILRVSLDQIEVRHDNNDQQAAQYWKQRQQIELQQQQQYQEQQQQQNQLYEQQQQQIQLTAAQFKKLIEDKREELESDLCLLQQIDMISNQMRQVDRTRLNESISELADELRLNLNTLDRQQSDYENSANQQQQQLQHSSQLVKDLYLIQAPSCYQAPEAAPATAAAAAPAVASANQNIQLQSGNLSSPSNLQVAILNQQQQQQSLMLAPFGNNNNGPNTDTTDHHHHYHYQTPRAHYLASSNQSSLTTAAANHNQACQSSSTLATVTQAAAAAASTSTSASSAQQTDSSIEFIISNSVPGRDSNNLGSTSVISEISEQLGGGPANQPNMILDATSQQQQQHNQHQQQLTSSSLVNSANYETLVVTFASKDRKQAFLQAFLEAKQARFSQIAQQHQRMLAMNSPSSSNSMSIKMSHPDASTLIKSQSIASDMRRTRLKHQDEMIEMRLSDSCVRGGSGSGVNMMDKRQEDRNSSAPCVGTIVHQMSAPQVSLGRSSDEPDYIHKTTGSPMSVAAYCATCNSTGALAALDKGLDVASHIRCQSHQQQQQQQQNSAAATSHHYHHHHQLIHQPASQPALLQTICCHDQHNDKDDRSSSRLLLNSNSGSSSSRPEQQLMISNLTETTLGAPGSGLQIDGHLMLPHDLCRLQSGRLDSGAGCRASLAYQCGDFDQAKQMESLANQTKLILEFAPKFLLTMPIDFLHTQQPALQFTCSVSKLLVSRQAAAPQFGSTGPTTGNASMPVSKVALNGQKCQTISDTSGQLWLCMSNGYVSHVALIFFVKKRVTSGHDQADARQRAAGHANEPGCYTIVPLVQSSGDICKSQITCAAQVSWFKPVRAAENGSKRPNKISEAGSVDKSRKMRAQESSASSSSLLDSLNKQEPSQEEERGHEAEVKGQGEAGAGANQQQTVNTPSFSIKAASPPVDIANVRRGGPKSVNSDSFDRALKQPGQHEEWPAISKSAPSRSLVDDSLDQLHAELFKRVGSSSTDRTKLISAEAGAVDEDERRKTDTQGSQSLDRSSNLALARRSSRDTSTRGLRTTLGPRQCQRSPGHAKAHHHHSHDQLRSRNYHRSPVSASVHPTIHNNCVRCSQQNAFANLTGQPHHHHHLFHHYHHHHHHHHHNLHHGHSHSHSHNHGHLQHHHQQHQRQQQHQASGEPAPAQLAASGSSGHQHHHLYYSKHHTVPLAELRKALERQNRVWDDKECLSPSGSGGAPRAGLGSHSARKQQRHLVPPINTPCQLSSGSLEFNHDEDQDDADGDGATGTSRAKRKAEKKARSATPPARYAGDAPGPGQYKSLRSAKLLRHQASLKTSSILAKLVGTASRGSSYLRKSSQCALGAASGNGDKSDKVHSDADDIDTDTDSGNVKAGGGGNSSSNESSSLIALPMLAYGGNKLQVLNTASNPNMANAAQIVSPLSSVSSLNSTNSSITVNSACASSPNRSSCNLLTDQPRTLSTSFCCPALRSSQTAQLTALVGGGGVVHHDHHYHHRVDDGELANAILRERSATVPCRAYCTDAFAIGGLAASAARAEATKTKMDTGQHDLASVHSVCPITLTKCRDNSAGARMEQLVDGAAGQPYKVSDIISDPNQDRDSEAQADAETGQAESAVTSLWVGCDDGSLVVIDCMANLDLRSMAAEVAAASDANPCTSCDQKANNNNNTNKCQNVHSEIKLNAPISDIKNYKDQIVFVALTNGQLAVFSRILQADDELDTLAVSAAGHDSDSSITDANNNNNNNNNKNSCNNEEADGNAKANGSDRAAGADSNWCRQLLHGQWSLANPQILTITSNELNSTSKLCLINDEHLWYSYGRNIFVLDIHTLKLITTIMTPTSDKSIQFAIQSTTIDTMELVRHLDGVWIAFKCSPLIQLYGHRDYKLLLEISLLEPINKVLSCGNEIIRQHKTTCLGTTSLLNIYNQSDDSNSLFVGTSAGIIIYLSVHTDQLRQQIEADKSVWSPQVISLRHGHSGQVKFMRLIELSDTTEATTATATATTLADNTGRQTTTTAAAADCTASPENHIDSLGIKSKTATSESDQRDASGANSADARGAAPLTVDSRRQDDLGGGNNIDDSGREQGGKPRRGNLYLVSGGAGIDLYGPNNSQQVVQHLSGDDDHLNHLILWQL